MDGGAFALVAGDAILAAGTVSAAIVAARRARSADRSATKAHQVGTENADTLAVLATRIEANRDEKIHAAVEQYAREHPGVIGVAVLQDALRDMLSTFVEGIADSDDYPHAGHHGMPHLPRRQE